jgi:hypothetical protein
MDYENPKEIASENILRFKSIYQPIYDEYFKHNITLRHSQIIVILFTNFRKMKPNLIEYI